jgi:hypothetical protein
VVTYGIARPVPGAGGMTDADWRELGSGLGDGIVNSTSPGGSSDFSAAPSSSGRTIVLNLGQIRIRGVQFRPTPTNATVTLTLPAVAEGSTRTDRIIARYDPAAADTDKITFLVLSGTAAASGTPNRPVITRVAGGVWDVPLHAYTGGNVTTDALTHEDHRIWVTSHLHGLMPPGGNTTLNQGFPDGTQYFDLPTNETWVQTYPGGVATWTNVDNPEWTDLNLGTALKKGLRAPQWRIVRGYLDMWGEAGPTAGPWVGGTTGGNKGLGVLPAAVAARIGFNRRFPIVLTGATDSRYLAVRAVIDDGGGISFWCPPGVNVGGACYDNIHLPLI